jgi:hypothetical protein
MLWPSLFLLVCLLAPEQTAPPLERSPEGTVQGMVLDGTGEPLAAATVYADSTAPHDKRRQLRTQTDAGGRFILKNVPAGKAYLHAFKESDGYPDVFFAFFHMPGQDFPPKVMVKPGETTSDVVMRLGAKAAVVKFKVTDENGTPVNGRAVFQRPDLGEGGTLWRSLGAEEVLQVPPVPFRVTVNADGYASWHYGGSQWEGDQGLVRLQSGETLELSVRLRPGAPRPTSTTGSITGTVFGADDEPIVSAQVEAEPVDGITPEHPRLRKSATTTGTFIFNDLRPANFRLSATKSELGYTGKMSSPFFAVPGREFPIVTVTAGSVATVEIRLGPKNGYVNMVITDKDGKPITSNAHVVMSRPDIPERLEQDARNRAFFLVPPTAMHVSVEADGYADWHFGGDKWLSENGLIHVNPGEIVDLKVQLRPNP